MHFNLITILVPLVGFASLSTAQVGRDCPDALRGGSFTVSPATLTPGEPFTVVANMTCANYLGFTPTYLDFYIQNNVNNNGFEPPILLSRGTYNQSADPPLYTFTTVLPRPPWTIGAVYEMVMDNSYARKLPPVGPGDTFISVSQVAAPINITGY
ncbi:hypothetical protein C8F04DRAFT_230138 [Mycena alexandri]|uniref:Uncharacterized protein n=1 Tax=Mycena alexandri TaxID=1745969 RepID=A0AAD6S7T7_9AGAR|nr:hypothetical protein C8F04DRAFT_230138 [Mycena alexandri]